MFDEPFRQWMSRTAASPARAMRRLGISPNQVTIGALVMGIAAAVVIALGNLSAGIAIWLSSRILDGYDGMLARLSGQTSLFGGFLDIAADMLAYSAMAIGFALAMPDDSTVRTVPSTAKITTFDCNVASI